MTVNGFWTSGRAKETIFKPPVVLGSNLARFQIFLGQKYGLPFNQIACLLTINSKRQCTICGNELDWSWLKTSNTALGDHLYFTLYKQSNQTRSKLTQEDKSCMVDGKTTGRLRSHQAFWEAVMK